MVHRGVIMAGRTLWGPAGTWREETFADYPGFVIAAAVSMGIVAFP